MTVETTEQQLQETAAAFRKALDMLPKDEPRWFKTFPEGTSHQVSRILAKQLIDLGYANIFICSGNVLVDDSGDKDASYYAEPNTFHAWLEVDGTIIDITADEFYAGPVIVTRDPHWHNTFTERRHREKLIALNLKADETALLQKVEERLARTREMESNRSFPARKLLFQVTEVLPYDRLPIEVRTNISTLDQCYQLGDPLELRRPDGTVIVAQSSNVVEYWRDPAILAKDPDHQFNLNFYLHGVQKEDVPIGSEAWMFTENGGGS